MTFVPYGGRKFAWPPDILEGLARLGETAAHDEAGAGAVLDGFGLSHLNELASRTSLLTEDHQRAIRHAIAIHPAAPAAALDRIVDCTPDEDTPTGSSVSLTYLWLTVTAGYAVRLLPAESLGTVQRLYTIARAPLNCERYATGSLRPALALHPSCPPDVLFRAAAVWSLLDAAYVGLNPHAPEEALALVALRQLGSAYGMQ